MKFHAFQMKKYLDELARLAGDDQKLQETINKFFGETYYNVVRLIVESVSKLKLPNPRNAKDSLKS